MAKIDNSSTFANNMSLPIHKWYRYTAGFSSEWVKSVVQDKIKKENDNSIKVLDPFAGSGTTLLACDEIGISSIGYESQPLVYKIACSKLCWDADIQKVIAKTKKVLKYAKEHKFKSSEFPEIVKKCYDEKNLAEIDALKQTIDKICKDDKEDKLVWVGFVSILRSSSHVGTAIWQYVLPNKTKAKVLSAFEAFERQMEVICEDIDVFQKNGAEKKSLIIQQDARERSSVEDNSIDLIITSPPYANNYDYADATRLELSILGTIKGWGDLQDIIRPGLVRSCSPMVSQETQKTYEYLEDPLLSPIHDEIVEVCRNMEREKENHGGKKNYYTMIALYFLDLAKIWMELRRVCKKGSLVCFVIGDSAPYGVYVPVDEWLGKLAVSAGFKEYQFEKTRDRNVKWKNRKHTVPLKEGRLWIRG
mgnify:FL=1